MHSWVLSMYCSSSHNPKSRRLGYLVILNWSQKWVWVCLVLCLCVHPVMDWCPVQGVNCFTSKDTWDRLQLPLRPWIRLSGYSISITTSMLHSWGRDQEEMYLKLIYPPPHETVHLADLQLSATSLLSIFLLWRKIIFTSVNKPQ